MGPAWSSQGHTCGPSVPKTKPPPHVCTLGPGPASLIPQPCRDQAFFFFLMSPVLSTLSHLLTYLRIGLRALWAVAGGWPQKFCQLSSLCSSWAFLRGFPQEHFLPPAAWGSFPEHPSYILRSQALSFHGKRLGGLTMVSSSWITSGIYVRCFRLSFPPVPSLPPLLRAWRLVLKEVRGWAHACRLAQHPVTLPTSAGSSRGHAGSA